MAYRSHDPTESPLSLLRPEDARRLRAQAWRYLRRINAQRARKAWEKARGQTQMGKAA